MTDETIIRELASFIEIQSSIAYLEKEISRGNTAISALVADIKSNTMARDDFLSRRERAEASVSKAEEDLEHITADAKERIEKAKAKVFETKQVKKELGDDILITCEGKLKQLGDDTDKIQSDREGLVEQLREAKTKASELQNNLKEKGYELNILAPRMPKTTNL